MGQGYRGYDVVFSIGGNPVAYARVSDLSLDAGEVETTARNTAGWKQFKQGLREGTLDIDILWIMSDAQNIAIRTAYLNESVIAWQAVDEDGYGWSGNAIVTHIGMEGTAHEDAVAYPVDLRLDGAASVVEPAS